MAEKSTPSRPPRTTGILRRKPIEDSGEDAGLERSIGLFQLTAIGLGAIIGAGIFALAGP
ncbi:MAG: amino acid permease, partial [Actinomycetota bacterium]